VILDLFGMLGLQLHLDLSPFAIITPGQKMIIQILRRQI